MQCNYPFPRAVLFDWDNTLMDTTPVLFKAFCVMRRHYDLPEYSMEEYQAKPGCPCGKRFPICSATGGKKPKRFIWTLIRKIIWPC